MKTILILGLIGSLMLASCWTPANASTLINCVNMGHITVCTNMITGEQVIVQTTGR